MSALTVPFEPLHALSFPPEAGFLQARALSAGGVAAWDWEVATGRMCWSPGLEALHGLAAGTFGGTTEDYMSLVYPDDRAAFRDAARRVPETGEDLEAVYRIVYPNGNIRWIETKGRAVRGAEGAVVGVTGFCADVSARSRAEAESRAREDRLQTLADNVPVLIARVDSDRRYVFANRAYEDLLGIPVALVVGRTMAEVLGPAAYEAVRPYVDRVLAGEAVQYDATLDYRTIGPRVIHSAYVPERGLKGEVTGFLLSAMDITARQEASEAARRLALIVENSHDAITSTDHEGTILSWNRGAERLYGWTAAEVIGRSIRLVFPPEQSDGVARLLDAQHQDGGALEYEAIRVRKDGVRRVVAVTLSPFKDGEGHPTGHTAIARDITEQKEAEHERKEAERTRQRLALIVENSHEAILSTGMDGTILSWNRGAERLYGWTAAEAMGRHIKMTFSSEGAHGEAARMRVFLADANVLEYEAVRVRKDGARRVLSVTYSPVRDEGGKMVGRSFIVRDITEQKEAERERERLLAQTKSLLAEATARADRDPLTGLLNHRAFHRVLEEEAARAGREGTFLAVAMLDLNNFKFFNDAYGHAVGDNALRQVADTLRAVCRPYDTLARFGGDEFAVLMPGVGRDEAETVAARLARGLADIGIRPFGDGADVPLGLSLGLSVFPDGPLSYLEALALADKRLYIAKSGGSVAGVAEQVRGCLSASMEGFSMLDALVTAVDNKDRYTRKHSEDVLAYSLVISDSLGLDAATRQTVGVAALLHDVGKIGVPDAVLRKPGRLAEDEMAAVRQHPVMGAVIVGAVPGLEAVLGVIRHHHERWDGGGYPDGLAGEAIPPIARLLAVADAYSAMTSDRPYRKGMDPDRARRIIEEGAGTQWDPACVQAFVTAVQDGGEPS